MAALGVWFAVVASCGGGTGGPTTDAGPGPGGGSGGGTPPPPPVAGSECAAPQPGWIWCDDFEVNRLRSYFEYDSAFGNFTRVAGVGKDSSYGMRARYARAGQVSAGALHLAFGRTPQTYFRPVDAGTADYREIYWRIYLRLQPGWIGGGGDKLSRAFIFASTTTWAQAMIAHVWSGKNADANYLLLDPASGTDSLGNLKTTAYNDFPNFRWLGLRRGVTPLFASASAGRWFCIEAHATMNDPGQSNGIFELWVDSTLEARRADLNWVGSWNAYGLNAVYFETYWNNGSPQPQERYFDNIVVSTRRIGC